MNNQSNIPKPWLLLPLEIKSRELEAKVMLSCIAAERGFGVLLGRNGFNLNGIYPRGAYLDKCLSPRKEKDLSYQVNEIGNKLVSLDEEGLVYVSEEKWLTRRISKGTVDLSSLILTWGDAQSEMIERAYQIPDKLVVTGSPRADLWRPEMQSVHEHETRMITEKYGNMILIPSNFPRIISANGPEFVNKQGIEYGFLKSEDDFRLSQEQTEYTRKLFQKFLELIPAIAEKFGDMTVVVRPHPGDNIRTWQNLSTGWPKNVRVIFQGSVTPWIWASKMLVHNSCTTGVEAFSMGKPVIAYTPFKDKRFDQNIPNPVSQQANTIDEVLDLIESNCIQNDLGRDPKKLKLFGRYIKTDREILAGTRIVDALESLQLEESTLNCPQYDVWRKLRISARKIKRRVRDITGGNEFSYAYRKQKNPGISLKEVRRLVEIYQKNLDSWENVRVEKIEEDLFYFYQ